MAWYEVYERDVLGKPGAARYSRTPSPVFLAAAQRLSGARVSGLWPPPATLDEIRQRRLEPPVPVYDPALILEVGTDYMAEEKGRPDAASPLPLTAAESLSDPTRHSLSRDLASGLWEMVCGLVGGVWDWITGGRRP